MMSPELVKENDGRPILNVSTSTSTSASLSPDSISRGEYLRRFVEGQNERLRNQRDRPLVSEDDDLMTEERVDASDIYGTFPSPGGRM